MLHRRADTSCWRKKSHRPRTGSVLAFLNIVANGMDGGLEQSVDQMDVKLVLKRSRSIQRSHRSENRALLDLRSVDGEHTPWLPSIERSPVQAPQNSVMYDFCLDRTAVIPIDSEKARPATSTPCLCATVSDYLNDGKSSDSGGSRQRGVYFELVTVPAALFRMQFRREAGLYTGSMSTDLHTATTGPSA